MTFQALFVRSGATAACVSPTLTLPDGRDPPSQSQRRQLNSNPDKPARLWIEHRIAATFICCEAGELDSSQGDEGSCEEVPTKRRRWSRLHQHQRTASRHPFVNATLLSIPCARSQLFSRTAVRIDRAWTLLRGHTLDDLRTSTR